MIRRRRPTREIPFSFDSFLDVVANVVGIIIRLILVVWVGARSYSGLHLLPTLSATAAQAKGAPSDPLADELARHRQDLAQAQARLLEQLRQLQQTQSCQNQLTGQLALVGQRLSQEEEARSALEKKAGAKQQATQSSGLSLTELTQRQKRLQEELRALDKLPPAHQVRYRTPVSRPVHSEEFMYECKAGRVAFIDMAALLTEVRHGFEDKAQLLRSRWQVGDVAGPAGAFQLRYTVERERDFASAVAPGGPPEAHGSFRYGIGECIVEPIAPVRGETLAAALASGSEFRRLVDALDPQQAVVTFWVYPDSFSLFRQLRDYLYERDLVVAGRPLPPGMPISCSRRGTLSRGQ
jgi:hypothetical protein